MSDFHIPNISFDSATIKGHMIPDTDDTYDIGSATYKIRDLYVSDNSLWVGDTHKVSISEGKMKFRKRKTTIVPAAITAAGGNQSSALAHAGVANLSSMKLKHWKNYMRSLSGQANANIQDIFRDNDDDYEEESAADNWLSYGTNTYNNIGNVGIGTNSPSSKLTVKGNLYLRTSADGDWNFNPTSDTELKITKTGTGNAEFTLSTGTSYLDTKLSLALNKIVFDCNGNSWFNGGNVGIGTNNPGYKLEVSGSIYGDSINIGSSGNEITHSTGNMLFSTAGQSNALAIGHAAGVTVNSLLKVTNTTGIEMNVASNNGTIGGICMRNGYTISNAPFHCGMVTYDHSGSGSGFGDGLVLSGYDGIAFATSNTTATSLANVRMMISQTGNVGIGTDSPGSLLHLKNGYMKIEHSGNGDIVFQCPNRPSIYQATTNVGLQIRSNGTGIMEINKDNASTGDVSINNGVIYVDASTGKVGIGDSTPGYPLDINSTEHKILRLKRDNTSGGCLLIGNNTTGTGNLSGFHIGYSSSNSAYLWNMEDSDIMFYTNGASDPARMTIKNDGKIGIGKTNPGYILDVVGDINLTGDLRINGTAQSFGGSGGSSVWDESGNIASYTGHSSYFKIWGNSAGDFEAPALAPHIATGNFTIYKGNVGSGIELMQVKPDFSCRIGLTTGLITGQSNSQANNSFVAGKGYLDVPWINTCGIEHYDEKGSGGTGMVFGSDRTTSAQDIMTFFTVGIERVQINASGLIIKELGDLTFQRSDGTESTTISSNNEGFMISESRGGNITKYQMGGDHHQFWTANTERIRIKDTGQINMYLNSTTVPLLNLRNGNAKDGFNNGAQIEFSYQGTSQYSHFIQTRHNSANSLNAIDFYTCNGTADNTITSGSIHTMSLVSGNVGIGITNPLVPLHISTTTSSGNHILLTNNSTGNGVNDGFRLGIDGSNHCYIWQNENKNMRFGTNNTDSMTILNNGNVGIGFTNPTYKLHVNGDIVTGNNNKLVLYRGGTQDPYLKHVGTKDIGFFCADSEKMRLSSGGKLGINTTNPAEKLHVVGKALINSGDTNSPQNAPYGGSGCRIILWPGSTSSTPYGFGIDGSTLWSSCPSAATHKWYVGTTLSAQLSSTYYDIRGDLRFGTSNKLRLDESSWQTCGNIELTSGSGTFGFHGSGSNTLGIYVDGNIRTDGIVFINGTQGIKTPTGNYGTIQTTGAGNGNWEGYSIDGRYVFMSADNNTCGLYNDLDNKWMWKYERNNHLLRQFVAGTEHMKIDNGGRLHCLNTGGNDSYCFSITTDNGKGQMAWRWNAAGGGSTDYNLDIYMDNNSGNNHKVGYLENSGSGSWRLNDFTGQHRCIPQNNTNSSMYGLIVYSTGKYMNIDNNISPTMIDSLPICDLCTIENDQRVFGVISDDLDDNDNRKVAYGVFGTYQEKTNKNEKRIYINGVGEGAMWVCNKNGNILNGSYITSSGVSGYGMKQDSNQLLNSTVAKITCDCDFNLNPIVKQKVKLIQNIKTLKRPKKIDYEVVQKEIKYDEEINQYREFEIIKSYSKIEIEKFPVCDSNGEPLLDNKGEPRTFEVEVMEEYQVTETDIDFDENGNIQYEDDLDNNGNQQMVYEYETRFLNSDGSIISTEEEYQNKKENGENVYISCFIGCTYHCG